MSLLESSFTVLLLKKFIAIAWRSFKSFKKNQSRKYLFSVEKSHLSDMRRSLSNTEQ